ncbi:MAG: DJ-1/PfpI family protein [Piscinibacter sp.]|nr:DJ-1/PfpI family protein [Piscinibacter sp.]
MTQHRVVVLALPGSVAFDMVAPVQVLRRVPKQRYAIEVCGVQAGPVLSAFGLQLSCERGLEALADADTVIVPGRDDATEDVAPAVLEALRAAHERGARIASICTGAFVLARAGLLDGLRATTHWALARTLAEQFPRVRVDADVLYVDEGRVLTSAGATAGIDLCIHLVRLDHGEHVANGVSRIIVASPHRSGGQAQFIARPLPPTRTRQLEPVLRWATENLHRELGARELAEKAGLTTRSLARRFQDELGVSPLQWLIEQRVRKAQQLLETSDLPVERIAQDCGFGTSLTCRIHFKRTVKVSPMEYRRTFRARGSASGRAPRVA